MKFAPSGAHNVSYVVETNCGVGTLTLPVTGVADVRVKKPRQAVVVLSLTSFALLQDEGTGDKRQEGIWQ